MEFGKLVSVHARRARKPNFNSARWRNDLVRVHRSPIYLLVPEVYTVCVCMAQVYTINTMIILIIIILIIIVVIITIIIVVIFIIITIIITRRYNGPTYQYY